MVDITALEADMVDRTALEAGMVDITALEAEWLTQHHWRRNG